MGDTTRCLDEEAVGGLDDGPAAQGPIEEPEAAQAQTEDYEEGQEEAPFHASLAEEPFEKVRLPRDVSTSAPKIGGLL